MDPDSDVIHSDHDESEDEDTGEASNSGDALFSAPQQVFIVRNISKAMTGFRPSVMCEGYLAELSKSSSGYVLAPLGRDQQLSFKYEPPSPKFSRKRPSCLSYRLQLLHGSQFLYSLRGLPKSLRCQRSAHALEWGPVHLVFAAAADLDTFVSTLKYVEVEEMSQQQETEGQQQHGAPRQPSGAGAAASSSEGGSGGGNRARDLSIGGSGMQWAVAAARLLTTEGAGDGAADHNAAGSSEGVPAVAAGASPVAARLGLLDWVRRCLPLSLESPLPLLTATAGAAVLAAAAAAALLLRNGGPLGRRRSA